MSSGLAQLTALLHPSPPQRKHLHRLCNSLLRASCCWLPAVTCCAHAGVETTIEEVLAALVMQHAQNARNDVCNSLSFAVQQLTSESYIEDEVVAEVMQHTRNDL